jgi:hypothetical protein
MSIRQEYDEIVFALEAVKIDKMSGRRVSRNRRYPKVNHAIRGLWRIRNLQEGFIVVRFLESRKRPFKIITRIAKKRAIDIKHVAHMVQGPPKMPDMDRNWLRLPNRHNDMFELFDKDDAKEIEKPEKKTRRASDYISDSPYRGSSA